MIRKFIQAEPTDIRESLIARIRKRPFHYIILLLLFINIALIVINIGVWLIAAKQDLFITADFTNFYTGFKMVLNGDGSKLYDLNLQAKYQQEIMGNINFVGGLLPYVNPPIVALVFAPLALLSINIAFYLWTIFEFGLLVWLVLLLQRLFSAWTKQECLIMTIAVLAFWPLTHTFLLGQFSLLFLICILQVYIAMRSAKLGKAGRWLVLLIIKPHTLLIPGVMTVNKRYWRLMASSAVTIIAMVIFSSAFLGFGTWFQYIQVLPTMSNNFGKFGFIPNIQYTLRGLLTNVLGYSQASLINLISIVVFMGGIVLVWLLWMQGVSAESRKFKLYFALTILLSAFLSLHAYPHDDLILVCPAVLFYDYLRENNYPKKAYSILILLSPFVFFIAAFTSFNLFGVFRPPLVIILIFLVWMIYYLFLDHRSVTTNQPPDLSTGLTT